MSTRIVKHAVKTQKVLAHKMVAQLCEEMAGAVYEELMQRNDWWEAWKARFPELSGEALQLQFIKISASGYTLRARAMLAEILKSPAYSHLHDQIAEALILDNQFTRDPTRVRLQ